MEWCTLKAYPAEEKEMYRQALQLFATAQFEKAIPLFNRVARKGQELELQLDALFYEALCYHALGAEKRAQELVREILRTHPQYRVPQESASPSVLEWIRSIRMNVLKVGEIEEWNDSLEMILEALKTGEYEKAMNDFKELIQRTWKNEDIKNQLETMKKNPPFSSEFQFLLRHLSYMTYIPAGTAIIGAGKSRRKVRLKSFYIDRYPVTVQEYESRGRVIHKRSAFPVTGVTYADAEKYCRLLGKRLPSAEEWEYVARGPKGLTLPFGYTFKKGFCQTKEEGGALRPVDARPEAKSPFDVLDMCGNVWEWTSSVDSKNRRIVKGGSFRSSREKALAFQYDVFPPNTKRNDLGFRCVLDEEVLQSHIKNALKKLEQFRINVRAQEGS